MKRTLVLHVGAHKTGSTFLQNTMKANVTILNRNGASYFGGEDARLNFTRNIIYPAVGLRKSKFSADELLVELRRILDDRAKDARSLLVSNENVLGYCDLVKNDGQLYPYHQRVLNFLWGLTPYWDIRIFFVIRSYDDFLESTYIQKIKEGFQYDFGEYSGAFLKSQPSWRPIVEAMRSIFGAERVSVFKYEDFRRFQQPYVNSIAEALCGIPCKLDMDTSRNANPSYSKVALSLALHANSMLRGKDLEDFRSFMNRRFPAGTYGRPQLLNTRIKDRLRSSYEEDCILLGA